MEISQEKKEGEIVRPFKRGEFTKQGTKKDPDPGKRFWQNPLKRADVEVRGVQNRSN